MSCRMIRILAITLSILLLTAGAIVLCNYLNMTAAEKKYRASRKDTDLVLLCIELYTAEDHAKMIKYVPKALEIDNDRDIIEIYFKEYITRSGRTELNSATEVEILYNSLLARFMMAYIYEEEYGKYEEVFPRIYRKFVEAHEHINIFWMAEVDAHKDNVTEEGYKIFINLLQNICPEEPHYPKTDYDTLSEYSFNTVIQSLMYYSMGNMDAYEEVSERSDFAIKRYLQEIRDAHES